MPKHAIAAGVGHRRRQLGIGNPAHAGQHDGMLDSQEVAKGCSQGHGFLAL